MSDFKLNIDICTSNGILVGVKNSDHTCDSRACGHTLVCSKNVCIFGRLQHDLCD